MPSNSKNRTCWDERGKIKCVLWAQYLSVAISVTFLIFNLYATCISCYLNYTHSAHLNVMYREYVWQTGCVNDWKNWIRQLRAHNKPLPFYISYSEASLRMQKVSVQPIIKQVIMVMKLKFHRLWSKYCYEFVLLKQTPILYHIISKDVNFNWCR